MQTIISLLLNPSSTEKGGRHSYFMVLLRIMDIADKEPELLDFYWPQVLFATTVARPFACTVHSPNPNPD